MKELLSFIKDCEWLNFDELLNIEKITFLYIS